MSLQDNISAWLSGIGLTDGTIIDRINLYYQLSGGQLMLPATTWANILLLNTTGLASGTTVRATDLGLHTFIWDGSNWQSLNNAPIKVGSSRTSVTTGVAGDSVAYSFSIPGSLLGNGGRITIYPKVSFTASANTKEVWLKDTALTNIVASAIGSGTSVVGLTGPMDCVFESTSSMARVLTKAASLPYANVIGSSLTPDTTVSRSYSLGITLVSGDTSTFYGYDAYVGRRV